LDKPKSRDELFAIIARNAVDFPPDQKASYSNANYILLGWIIEDVTHQSLAGALQERICKRIGLRNTYLGAALDTLHGESYSYKFVTAWQPETITDMSIPGGAGSVVSTSSDLCLYIESLFAGKLMADSMLLKMKTTVDGFGMGMFSYPFINRRAYGHTGGIDGFSTMLTYFPEDSLAVAYCSNAQAYGINDIMIGVLSIYYNQPYLLPVFKHIALKPEDLDRYIGLYSSNQLPMKISITKDSVSLIAQASGQSSFRLEAIEMDKFSYDLAGLKMDFIPDRKEMILRQGGGVFVFTKEK
jgi:CubicO group peptidase (beta-lactamase class C family)